MPTNARDQYRPLTEEEIAFLFRHSSIKPHARPLYLYNRNGHLCRSRRLPSWTNCVLDFKKSQNKIRRLKASGDHRGAKNAAHRLFRSRTARRIAAKRALKTIPATQRSTCPSADEIVALLSHTACVEASIVRVIAEYKSNGGLRITYSYSVIERAFQILVALTFGQLVTFHPAQYGVPGASRQQAVTRIRNHIKSRRYKFGVEADISSFFPSVDTSRLAQFYGLPEWIFTKIATNQRKEHYRPGNRIANKHWNQILQIRHGHGLPQGAATSPLFAYGLLKSVLDQFDASGIDGVEVVNYCDNFLILGESRDKVRQAFETLSHLFSSRSVISLVLRQCGEIRQLSYGIDFIGFRFKKKEGSQIVSLSKERIGEIRQHYLYEKHLTRGSVSLQFLMQKTIGRLQGLDVAPQQIEKLLNLLNRDRYLKKHKHDLSVQLIYKFIRDRRPSKQQKRDNILGSPTKNAGTPGPTNAHLAIQGYDVPRDFRVRDAERRLQNQTPEERAAITRRMLENLQKWAERQRPST